MPCSTPLDTPLTMTTEPTPYRSNAMTTKNPTAFNQRLGTAVRSNRVLAGLTQKDIGDALGVTFQQVQKYERGVNRISVETLIKVATAINTTPQQLIDDAIAG